MSGSTSAETTPLTSRPPSDYGLGSSSGTQAPGRRRKPKDLTRKWYISYYVPAIAWVSSYRWAYLPGDIAAGLSLTSFMLPISLSYATSLAHVPAASGCFGLILPPVVYALLGSVPTMIVGPEAAISLVVGHAVLPYLHPDKPAAGGGAVEVLAGTLKPIKVVSLLTGSVGAMALLAGLMRIGFLESILSQSLLRGFVTGVGVVMVVDQLPTQLGLGDQVHRDLGGSASSFERLLYVIEHWRSTHVPSAAFAFTCLAVLLAWRLLRRRWLRLGYTRVMLIPDILAVVVAATLVCQYFGLDRHGVSVIGNVKPGKLHLEWPLRPKYWRDFRRNFSTSFFVTILGFLETTVAARSLGSVDIASSANRELVALGAANLAGMVFGALPSFGGYGRSKLGVLSGAKTQLTSVVVALVTLFVMYNLLGFLYYTPYTVLSAVISLIGITLVEEAPEDVNFFLQVRGYSDIVTMVVCLLFTFFWSVEAGVACGAGFAVLRVLYHATRPRIQILTRRPGTHSFVNADLSPDVPAGARDLDSGILVVRIPEPLTFANSGDLRSRLRRLELHGTCKVHPNRPRTQAGPGLHHVVFELTGMTEMDATAAANFRDIVADYIDRGVIVLIADLSPKAHVRSRFARAGLRDLIEGQDCAQAMFGSLEDAVASFDDRGGGPGSSMASSVHDSALTL